MFAVAIQADDVLQGHLTIQSCHHALVRLTASKEPSRSRAWGVLRKGRSIALPACETPVVSMGFRPGDACRDLLTEQEAIHYLRLDTIDIKNPDETLQRYRKEGHLRGTQVSKRVFYLREELDAFLKRLTEQNPR